jgi:hypothetical protein
MPDRHHYKPPLQVLARLRRRGKVNRAYMHIDLSGSRLGPNLLSLDVELRDPGALAGWAREAAAEFYRVPLEQVGPVELRRVRLRV